MAKARNLVVAQSGGPSPVINNSLRGIVEQARELAEIGAVYGARHGIEGVLKEELLDLSAQPDEEVSLLRYTPAAGSIGTCRYKLRPQQTEDFDRVLEVFRAHDIGYFLYIGGNDSMDTANKVAARRASGDWSWWALACPRRSTTTSATASSSSSTIRPATARWPNTGCTWCRRPTRKTPARVPLTRSW